MAALDRIQYRVCKKKFLPRIEDGANPLTNDFWKGGYNTDKTGPHDYVRNGMAKARGRGVRLDDLDSNGSLK
jgi:hypothetical protein